MLLNMILTAHIYGPILEFYFLLFVVQWHIIIWMDTFWVLSCTQTLRLRAQCFGTSPVCLVVVFLGVAPLYELPLYFLVIVDYQKKHSLLTRPQLISPTCQTSIRTHENICTRNTRPDKWTHLHLDFCLTLTLIRAVTSVFTQGCFCFVL